VFSGPVDAYGSQAFGILFLVLVDEDLEHMGIGEKLRQHYALRGLVGTDLVDRRLAWHSECHDDPAAVFFDELLAFDPEVFEPRHRPTDDLEFLAVAGAGLELVDGFSAHVVTGEHGVGDADTVHPPILARLERGSGVRGPPVDLGASVGETPSPVGSSREKSMTSTGSSPSAGSSREDWTDRDHEVVWHGFTQMGAYAKASPLIVERADGRYLFDVEGRRYFDGISSLWVNTLGHKVPELDRAVRLQLDKVAHSTMLGNGSRVVVELSEALAGVLPVDGAHLLFASDGASAVEQALKIAFQYWANSGISGRTSFLALGGAYHGDTVGSLSVGDGGFGTELFDPLRFPVLRTPGYDDPGWVEKALVALDHHARDLAAVIIEPVVQGASGMLVADPVDVGRFGRACADAGVLLIADEVATGFGRTTRMFASDWCEIRPDIMCLGKGITGGYLPMSVTATSQRIFEAFLGEDLGTRTFFHGHSYGGNALAAAVALEHLRLYDHWNVLEQAAIAADLLGGMLDEEIAPHPAVAEVRRFGLMAGVQLAVPDRKARWGRRVSAAATNRGVLLRPLGDVVVLMPPLTSTAAEIRTMVDALREALVEVAG